MKKSIIKNLIIYLVGLVVVLSVWNIGKYLLNGTNFEKDGKATYYYFPADYECGIYSFGQIHSKERDGAKIKYTGEVLYDSAALEYIKITNNISSAYAKSSTDIGKNLCGAYYNDGKLAAVMYNNTNSYDEYKLTGMMTTRSYLKIKFYDEDGKRVEDIAAACGEAYALDIAESIRITQPNESISRVYVVCGRDEIDTYYISVYISSDEIEFDREQCDRVPLLSTGGIDCDCYLKTIIYSDDVNEDNMRIVAERAAELLNGEKSESINKADNFEVIVVT